MALRSLMMLRGLIEGTPGGSKNIVPADMQNNTPPLVEIQLELANGDNLIAVPGNADGCVIIFDPTSVIVKYLKGPLLDTGIPLGRNKWNVITFDGTVPFVAFYINAVGADAGKTTTIIFF